MSEPVILEQIQVILGAVSGVGVVHDYERWADTWEKFLEHFKTGDGKINGWTISRFKLDEICESSSHDLTVHHYRIRGHYGLNDAEASERTFQGIVDAVVAAFRANYRLNDTAHNTTPLAATVIENRTFGGVLCHYCELVFKAEEWNAWS